MITKIKRKDGFSYCARVFINRVRISKTFKLKAHAEAWERKQLHEQDSGRAGIERLEETLTLREFSEKWMREKVDARLAPASRASYRADLDNHILPALGHLRLHDLQQSHGHQLMNELQAKKLAPKTINDMLGMLKGMLKDAVRWQCLSRNALEGLTTLRVLAKPDVYWTEEEVDQFFEAAKDDPLAPVVLFALNTGMRRGEICALKWDRVSFPQGLINVTRSTGRHGIVETTKTGSQRFIPMNGVVRDLLMRLRKALKSEFAFCKADGSPLDAHHLYRDFQRAQNDAGMKQKIRFHDLRHTYASNFMMNGGNLYDLQKILGHTTPEMTQRYAHLSPMHLAKAAEIVNFGSKWQQSANKKETEAEKLVSTTA